jgi:hypothetical protein
VEVIGFIGVAILLAAFFANLVGWLVASSKLYQGLNALGAAIAGYASYAIDFMPFVVLEGTWCAVALISLFRPRPETAATTALEGKS